DAQIFSQTACFNMDMAAFYTKFIRDIRDDQDANGVYPYYAPFNGRYTTWHDIGWQVAGIMLPWRSYEHYADIRGLTDHYLSIGKWMQYVTNTYMANPPADTT